MRPRLDAIPHSHPAPRSASANLSAALWRKSTYSNSDGGEIADRLPNLAPVRDSKAQQGSVLLFPAPA